MSFLEICFKVLFTVVLLLLVFALLSWIWTHQIDPIATFKRLIKNKSQEKVDWIATRDPSSIYQNGEIVGKISGQVQESINKIVFYEIYDTEKFNSKQPFEYKRKKLMIDKIGFSTGLDINMVDGKTEIKHSVLRNVECKILN